MANGDGVCFGINGIGRDVFISMRVRSPKIRNFDFDWDLMIKSFVEAIPMLVLYPPLYGHGSGMLGMNW